MPPSASAMMGSRGPSRRAWPPSSPSLGRCTSSTRASSKRSCRPAVGNEREVVIVSGLAEIAGAAAVLHPGSRRLGAGGCSPCSSRSSRPTSTWRSIPSRWRDWTCGGCPAGRCGRGCRCSRWRCSGSGARPALEMDWVRKVEPLTCIRFVCRASVVHDRGFTAMEIRDRFAVNLQTCPSSQGHLPGRAWVQLRPAPDRDLAARARRPRAAAGHPAEAGGGARVSPEELSAGIRWQTGKRRFKIERPKQP